MSSYQLGILVVCNSWLVSASPFPALKSVSLGGYEISIAGPKLGLVCRVENG